MKLLRWLGRLLFGSPHEGACWDLSRPCWLAYTLGSRRGELRALAPVCARCRRFAGLCGCLDRSTHGTVSAPHLLTGKGGAKLVRKRAKRPVAEPSPVVDIKRRRTSRS